jgi:hypothetical protein
MCDDSEQPDQAEARAAATPACRIGTRNNKVALAAPRRWVLSFGRGGMRSESLLDLPLAVPQLAAQYSTGDQM